MKNYMSENNIFLKKIISWCPRLNAGLIFSAIVFFLWQATKPCFSDVTHTTVASCRIIVETWKINERFAKWV